MKKAILVLSLGATVLALTGCETGPDGRLHSLGCGSGTNYTAAAGGAVAGGLAGSLIGGGTGQLLATGAGAALGGVAGSRSNLGC